MRASNQPKIDVTNLKKANRTPVIRALAGFSGKPYDSWLPQTHCLHTGEFLTSQGHLVKDHSTFKRDFSDKQTVEVLAAVAPNHCMDGWTYLSGSISSLLSGDLHSARHLAYYAQLRAAMSILACNGIGVFNTINFAIDVSENRHPLYTNHNSPTKKGTHVAVWEILQHWIADPRNARTFLESVTFRGGSLADCIDSGFSFSGSGPLVADVIDNWGVDLRRMANEREARNVSSYAPHALNPLISDLAMRLDLVLNLWQMLEPDATGGFPIFDRHLLRRFLDLMRKQQRALGGRMDSWESIFPNLSPLIQQLAPLNFLRRIVDPDEHVVFTYALDTSVPSGAHCMVCRALLLLRINTAVVQNLLNEAGFISTWDKTRPWLDFWGSTRGFWSKGLEPSDVTELWTDVALGVTELEESIDRNPTDQKAFIDSMNSELIYLSQAERAFMWSICV